VWSNKPPNPFSIPSNRWRIQDIRKNK
jgi:hypothetical protein